jgi:hypothetical protein
MKDITQSMGAFRQIPLFDVQQAAQNIQGMGRYGDTILAHINPQEAMMLDQMTDGASVNPMTGMLEFYEGGTPDGEDPDDPDTSEDVGSDPSDSPDIEQERAAAFPPGHPLSNLPPDFPPAITVGPGRYSGRFSADPQEEPPEFDRDYVHPSERPSSWSSDLSFAPAGKPPQSPGTKAFLADIQKAQQMPTAMPPAKSPPGKKSDDDDTNIFSMIGDYLWHAITNPVSTAIDIGMGFTPLGLSATAVNIGSMLGTGKSVGQNITGAPGSVVGQTVQDVGQNITSGIVDVLSPEYDPNDASLSPDISGRDQI